MLLQGRPSFLDPERDTKIVVFFYGRGEITNHNWELYLSEPVTF